MKNSNLQDCRWFRLLTGSTIILVSAICLLLTAQCRAQGYLVYKDLVSDPEKYASVAPYDTLEIFPVVYNLKTADGVRPIRSYLVLANFDKERFSVPSDVVNAEDVAGVKERLAQLQSAVDKYSLLRKYVADWILDLKAANEMISTGLIRSGGRWMNSVEYAKVLSDKKTLDEERILDEKAAAEQKLLQKKDLAKQLDDLTDQIQSISSNINSKSK